MIEKFRELLGEDAEKYDNHSIYNSEMYCFWKFAQDHDVKRIVESGTYHGSSIRRLRKLFPDADITTFELRKGHFDRIIKVGGVDYRIGELKDNLKLIDKNTAVLIDGPKRKLAIRLARKCLKKGALFVGMHDMYEYVSYLKTKFKTVKHSGRPTKDVKALDDGVDVWKRAKGLYGTVLAVVK